MEEWRRSNICPDYEVNNYGTVRNIETKEKIYPTSLSGSTMKVRLRVNEKFKYYKLADIVADAFSDDNSNHSNMKVIHKNGNRQDNRPENLEYVYIENKKTISYNNTKIRCYETMETYHNLYECECDLGIGLKKIANCIRDGSLVVETLDGDIYHFEIVDE